MMRLYLFKYANNKDYETVWIPAYSPECAKFKAQKKNVVCDDSGPVIIAVDSKPLNENWS
jgi:hypothetical protein